MDWDYTGVYGDENMPAIDMSEGYLGSWYSEIIDLSHIVSTLTDNENITYARITWESTAPEYGEAAMFYSVDGGANWTRVIGGNAIIDVFTNMHLLVSVGLFEFAAGILEESPTEFESTEIVIGVETDA